MKLQRLVFCLAVFGLLGLVQAAAIPPLLRLVPQSDLAPHLAALPRLAASDGAHAARINRQLMQADARGRSAAAECHAQVVAGHADPSAGWKRRVSVAMRGPRYLALVVSDDWYCGGAYPDTSRFALAYDLDTGAPLNWERLLPKSLAQHATLDTAGDGTRLGVVASPALKALYVATAKVQADCKPVLHDTELSFILWPDARQNGIVLRPSGLPHAIEVCGPDALIGMPALRKLGVNATLLDAIAAAHETGMYGLAR